MKQIASFLKKETILVVAWILAVVSCFFIRPDKYYISYIDLRSLGILWSLMVIMEGLQCNGVFEFIGQALLRRTRFIWQLCSVLLLLCFFGSMLITNDVALITFVPFTLLMLKKCRRPDLIVPVVVLQTMAANLGSMLTPVGNPQNLYLYGLSGLGIGEFIQCMLPFSAASFLLLAGALCLLKGKNEKVEHVAGKEQTGEQKRRKRSLCYLVLFLLALLAVLRLVPYYILVAVVFLTVLVMQRKVLLQIDYALLFTFVGFFLFTGNLGRIPVVHDTLTRLIQGREVPVAVLASQVISNVPAALLLSGFTENYKSLLAGVNIGGLGTLIASMASLISYKIVAREYPAWKGKYFVRFTVVGVVFLAALLLEAYLLAG